MRMSWVLCVLLGTLAWGQSAPASPPSGQPAQAPPPTAARPPAPATGPDTAASVPADAAVITVVGVCPPAPKAAAGAGTATKSAGATKTATADCKTVITKAEFEKLMSSIPNANPQMKKQIASVLPRLIAMSDAAKKKGLDKTP